MSYFAAALARGSKGWSGSELDLDSAADIEEVADLLRAVDPDAEVSLLFVEVDDTYLVIVRLDQGEDLRVFGSDAIFAEESRLGALLLSDVQTPATQIDDGGAPVTGASRLVGPPGAEPVGDADLLADLGVSAQQLLTLCGQEGMLPADVTTEVCQMIGCADEVENLREG